MKLPKPPYDPVTGKTYSLFGNSGFTSAYYETIRMLADKVQALHPDLNELTGRLRVYSSVKRRLKKHLGNSNRNDTLSYILNLTDPILKEYTANAEEHLASLPVTKLWDRRLATSREQYHLYMLEIELINRLNVKSFIYADRKIALMPYCLQDFSVSCKSSKQGFDCQCRNCSSVCYQNLAGEILKNAGIEPYIWMEGDMKELAKITKSRNKTFGVLGIACIPELTFGMRSCIKANIPAIGIPLNANRCRRWYGEFFQNSIDLEELSRLVTG